MNIVNQGNTLPTYYFDTSGTYTVQLVAWQNNPTCADTFLLQIVVFDSLIVQIPNVFSPNGDKANDLFTITANQDVHFAYTIVNRWGNPMMQGKGMLLQGTPAPLWDGMDATDGSYFLKIVFEQLEGTKINYQGVFQLVR